jgi:hypothetical protein
VRDPWGKFPERAGSFEVKLIGPLRSMGPRGRSLSGALLILHPIPLLIPDGIHLFAAIPHSNCQAFNPANHLLFIPPRERRRSAEILAPFPSSQ